MKPIARVATLLDGESLPMWRKLDMRERDEVARDFVKRPGARLPSREDDPGAWERLELARYLREQLEALATRHGALTHSFRVYQQRLDLAETTDVRHALMLEFLALLGAGPRRLRGDRSALARWLDVDAVAERYDGERARIERRIRFCLERLGPLARQACTLQPTVEGVSTWTVLDLEGGLRTLLGFPGDPRIRESALACLRVAMDPLQGPSREQLARSTVQYIYRTVLDVRQSVWLQCEALETLACLAPEELQPIAEHHLSRPAVGDEMFFRRRLVEALVTALPAHPGYTVTLSRLADDPAPFVREGLADLLPRLPAALAFDLWTRLLDDPEPAVAGRALLQTIHLVEHVDVQAGVINRFLDGLAACRAEFPHRVAIHLAPDLLARVRAADPAAGNALHAALEDRLTQLHTAHPRTATRRRAVTARELLDARAPAQVAQVAQVPLHARLTVSGAD
ncbi:MAG: hypothetical protein H0W24_09620, partial [Lysobacter sp.]|nr:hypothetical protein [Lysobacter sp.]